MATYKKSIREVHNISALLGIEYRNDIDQQLSATGNSFPTDLQYLNSAAVPINVTESWTGYATFSQFTRLGYNYDSRYNVQFTLRRDGSSRFGANHLYGIFPSVQFAWNASEESKRRSVTGPVFTTLSRFYDYYAEYGLCNE
ncbi:MAG TPA: hypothetical protein VNA26_07085 [Chitinophagaceae bacterium]|nr:hypothetical protein [Chitinophagaceae bacterium]